MQHLAQHGRVPGLVLAHGDVRTVERDHARFVPGFDEWQQMHTRMAEVDVHQLGTAAAQDAVEHLELAPVNHRFPAQDVFQIEAAQEVLGRLTDQFHVFERVALGVEPGLRHHEGPKCAQPRHLPVDVRHLTLEESGAITGDYEGL